MSILVAEWLKCVVAILMIRPSTSVPCTRIQHTEKRYVLYHFVNTGLVHSQEIL